MEDVIGGHTDVERFADFLANWRERLAARTERAVMAISAIDGVDGLILAGSIGAAAPWSLSDIDLLPIYDANRQEAAQEAAETIRLAILDQWTGEGWWTGLDIGRHPSRAALRTEEPGASPSPPPRGPSVPSRDPDTAVG